jgi:hypothetical protein
MARHPLFRDEENANQPSRLAQTGIPPHAASGAEKHQKASPDDALWNRMNLAMRFSCQPSKPPIKR